MEETKKSKKGLLVAIIIIILLAAIGVAGFFAYTNFFAGRTVKVTDMSGDVTLIRNDEEAELSEGMVLQMNDKLKTGKKGKVEILADSDKHIELSDKTCARLGISGNNNRGYIKVKLIYGEVSCNIEEKLAEKSEFIVFTPNAVCEVKGTEFSVKYDKDTEQTIVIVEKGKVQVTTEDDKASVKKEEKAIISGDKIEVMDASEDAPAATEEWEEVETEVVEAEEAMVAEELSEYAVVPGRYKDGDVEVVVKENSSTDTYDIMVSIKDVGKYEGTAYKYSDDYIELQGDSAYMYGYISSNYNGTYYMYIETDEYSSDFDELRLK